MLPKDLKKLKNNKAGNKKRILHILIITASWPLLSPRIYPVADTCPTAWTVPPIIFPCTNGLSIEKKSKIWGKIKILIAPIILIVETDNNTSFLLDFIIDEAATIAEDPHIAFPKPIINYTADGYTPSVGFHNGERGNNAHTFLKLIITSEFCFFRYWRNCGVPELSI